MFVIIRYELGGKYIVCYGWWWFMIVGWEVGGGRRGLGGLKVYSFLLFSRYFWEFGF